MSTEESEKSQPIVRLGVPIVALLLVAWIYLSGLRRFDGADQAIGENLEFSLKPLLYTRQDIGTTETKGKIVLINYWGTWCPPCRAEFPYLTKMVEKHKDNPKFQFVSVSCEEVPPDELAKKTKLFMEKQKARFPIHHDLTTFSRRKLMDVMNQTSFIYPTTVLLDKDGTIQGLWQGFSRADMKKMEKRLNELLLP